MDIIVVKYADDVYKSSPFRIRFGTFKIFRTKEKIVDVYVNGKKCDLNMRLSDSGEAYFQQEEKKVSTNDVFLDGYSSPVDLGKSAPTSPRYEHRSVTLNNSSFETENKTVVDNHLISNFVGENKNKNLDYYLNTNTNDSTKVVLEKNEIISNKNNGEECEIQNSLGLQIDGYSLKSRKLSFDLENNISKEKIYRKFSCDAYLGGESKVKVCKESDISFSSNMPNMLNLRRIELSNCWDKISKAKEKLEEIFTDNKISKEEFFKDPWKVLASNNLAIKYENHVYTWKVIAPLIISNLCFGEDLPENIMNSLTLKEQGYLFWKKKNQDAFKIDIKNQNSIKNNIAELNCTPNQNVIDVSKSPTKSIDSSKSTDDGKVTPPENTIRRQSLQFKKTYTLTSNQIKSLNLIPGKNEISFVVANRFQGETKITTEIFLWDCTDKIIISDLDGTITKSDVLGQVFPIFGKDWSHNGVVKLYNNLHKNGYKILYLTARALCQCDQTKNYLNRLEQDKKKLPEGPLLMSPDGLISSFKREVIDRTPQSFKIQCLTQILNLFPPEVCPYYAGFGNKITDAIAYESVGVNKNKIFIINEKGRINQYNKYYITTYTQLDESIEELFPDVRSVNCFNGNLNYFKPSYKDFKNIKDLFK